MNLQNNAGQHTGVNFFTAHALVAGGTATFAGVDVKDFVGDIALVLASTNAVAGTGAAVTLLHSSDNSTFATWAGSPTFALVTSAAQGPLSASLDTRSCLRYVQAKHVVTGTTATFDLALIGVGVKQNQ